MDSQQLTTITNRLIDGEFRNAESTTTTLFIITDCMRERAITAFERLFEFLNTTEQSAHDRNCSLDECNEIASVTKDLTGVLNFLLNFTKDTDELVGDGFYLNNCIYGEETYRSIERKITRVQAFINFISFKAFHSNTDEGYRLYWALEEGPCTCMSVLWHTFDDESRPYALAD